MNDQASTSHNDAEDGNYIKPDYVKNKADEIDYLLMIEPEKRNAGQKARLRHLLDQAGLGRNSPQFKAHLAAMSSTSRVTIKGEERYAFVHGTKPRGKGTWIFSPCETHDWILNGMTPGEHYFQAPQDTLYAQAKKQARIWATDKGYEVIYVQT
jgi:hypothetical protein